MSNFTKAGSSGLAIALWRQCEAVARMQRDRFEEVEHEVGVVAFGGVGLTDRAVVAADEETSVRR